MQTVYKKPTDSIEKDYFDNVFRDALSFASNE